MSALPDLTARQGFILCLISFLSNLFLFSLIYKLLSYLHKQGKFCGMKIQAAAQVKSDLAQASTQAAAQVKSDLAQASTQAAAQVKSDLAQASTQEAAQVKSDLAQASNWIVSSVQAVVAGIMGFVVYSETGGKQMEVPCNLVRWYGWVSLGYWIYDTVCMYNIVTRAHSSKNENLPEKQKTSFLKNVVRFVKWWPLLVAHHLVIMGVVIPGILLPSRVRGDGIIGMSFLMEWSSIFVAWRSCLSRLGFKSTTLYRVVSVLMIVVFFLVRIVLLPVALRLCSTEADVAVTDLISSLPTVCKVGTIAFYCLNLYWFSLMIMGLKKAIMQSLPVKNKSS